MNLYRSILVCLVLILSNNILAQPSDLIIHVMDELSISIGDCDEMGQFPEKVLPYNKDLTVIVIPKTGEKEEGWFALDSYVVVVNNKTKIIKHLYFESYKTSGWESDAVFIYDITIDTARYLVQNNVRAFGVVLHTRNMSQPNPYSSNYISLFVPDGEKLQNILKNFEIYSYGGETDMNCFAEMYSDDKTLILSKNKTNNYFDINVDVLHKSINFKEKGDDDCIETETSTNSKQVLKFIDGSYKTQAQ